MDHVVLVQFHFGLVGWHFITVYTDALSVYVCGVCGISFKNEVCYMLHSFQCLAVREHCPATLLHVLGLKLRK